MLKSIFKDCITQFKNNPFFRKTIELYVITGAVIFFLFGIVTILGVSRTSVSQLNATEKKMLMQACNTSNFVFRDIHSLANNAFEADSAILSAMSSPYSTVLSQEVKNSFSDIMASSKLIDSLYIVNFKDDVIYSTQTSAKTADEFFDQNILQHLANSEVKSDIFFSRKATLDLYSSAPQTVNYVTSVYRNSRDCAMIVNISQDKLQSMINLASDNASYETVILNSDGIVISHTNPEHFAENMSEDPLFKKILASGRQSDNFKHKGSVVNYVYSNTLGYFYVSISKAGTPIENFKNFLIYMILFTILLLFVFIVCSALASLSTYSVYNNIKKNIYNMFNKSEADEPTGDEIENISRLLNEAKTRYRSLETIQYQHTISMQNSVLKKLLFGTFAYLQDDMNSCGIEFPYQGFAVILVKVDNVSKMDSDTIYMLNYAIANMGVEIFEKRAKAYSSDVNEYNVAFILNFMSEDFIEEDLRKLNSYMQNFFNATVSASYDSIVTDSLEDISVLYHNANHAALYRLVYGHSSIIKYADIAQLDNNISAYPEETERDIIKSISVQDEEALEENIKRFTKELGNSSSSIIHLYTNRLLLAVDQFSLKTNMSDETDITANVHDIISEFEVMEDVEEYILNKCQNLMLKFSNAKFDSKKDVMVKNVLDYIDENYTDPNLSIDMIATKINRSANYTRSMFKQSQGISISDYIAEKRFDEVCRLLVDTNLTAQEIGKQLGLNSGSYFYTSFKKHTGYTPEQYRKLHRNMND